MDDRHWRRQFLVRGRRKKEVSFVGSPLNGGSRIVRVAGEYADSLTLAYGPKLRNSP